MTWWAALLLVLVLGAAGPLVQWWRSCRRRGHDDLELIHVHNDGRVAWRARRCQRCGSLRMEDVT